MSVRKFLTTSFAVRNLVVRPHKQMSLYHTTNSHLATDKAKLQPQPQTHPLLEEDSLLADLDTPNPAKILHLLDKHKHNVEGSHVLAALTSLFKSYKKMLSEHRYSGGGYVDCDFNLDDFRRQIVGITETNVKKLTGSQAAQIYNLLLRLRLPEASAVNEIVLRRVDESMGDLSIADFGALSHALRKMPKTRESEARNLELKKKFVKAMTMRYDETDLDQVVQGFYFASVHLNNSILDVFVRRLLEIKEGLGIKHCVAMLEALCTMEYYPSGWVEVLRTAEEGLIRRVHLLNDSQTNYVIFLLAQKIKETRREEFYNPELFDHLSQKLIDADMGFESSLNAIKCISGIRHHNKELLNYACAAYFERTTLVGETIEHRVEKLIVLLNGLALASYKTIFWQDMQASIMDYDKLLSYDFKTLCIVVLNCLCLDCYPAPLLERLFSERYDFRGKTYLHWSFCKIYQKLKADANYGGAMPSEEQLRSLEELQRSTLRNGPREMRMLPYLREAIGGDEFVKSFVYTRNFCMIEYVVAFDKNNEPIPINSKAYKSIEYLEDLNLPAESQIILVIYLPAHWYFRNVDELLTPYKISLDSLEKMCNPMILINTRTWNSVPDDQKTEYLKTEIKAKLRK